MTTTASTERLSDEQRVRDDRQLLDTNQLVGQPLGRGSCAERDRVTIVDESGRKVRDRELLLTGRRSSLGFDGIAGSSGGDPGPPTMPDQQLLFLEDPQIATHRHFGGLDEDGEVAQAR